MAHEKQSSQIDIQDILPILSRDINGHDSPGDTGRIDQDIYFSKLFDGFLDYHIRSILVRYIQFQFQIAPPKSFYLFFCVSVIGAPHTYNISSGSG